MVRIIKKNDESSMEYQLGDVLEVDSTWYGGVTVKSNSGILVPLDKDEYESVEEKEEKIEQTTEQLPIEQRDLVVGDIVRHFKLLQNIYIKFWHLPVIQKQEKD